MEFKTQPVAELLFSLFLHGSEPCRPEKLQPPEHDDAGGHCLQSLLCRRSPQMLPSRNTGDYHRPHRKGWGNTHYSLTGVSLLRLIHWLDAFVEPLPSSRWVITNRTREGIWLKTRSWKMYFFIPVSFNLSLWWTVVKPLWSIIARKHFN